MSTDPRIQVYRLVYPDIEILDDLAGQLSAADLTASEMKEAAIALKQLVSRARANPYFEN